MSPAAIATDKVPPRTGSLRGTTDPSVTLVGSGGVAVVVEQAAATVTMNNERISTDVFQADNRGAVALLEISVLFQIGTATW